MNQKKIPLLPDTLEACEDLFSSCNAQRLNNESKPKGWKIYCPMCPESFEKKGKRNLFCSHLCRRLFWGLDTKIKRLKGIYD